MADRPKIHPECEVGKHGNCGGVLLDDDDEWVDCECPCHRPQS